MKRKNNKSFKKSYTRMYLENMDPRDYDENLDDEFDFDDWESYRLEIYSDDDFNEQEFEDEFGDAPDTLDEYEFDPDYDDDISYYGVPREDDPSLSKGEFDGDILGTEHRYRKARNVTSGISGELGDDYMSYHEEEEDIPSLDDEFTIDKISRPGYSPLADGEEYKYHNKIPGERDFELYNPKNKSYDYDDIDYEDDDDGSKYYEDDGSEAIDMIFDPEYNDLGVDMDTDEVYVDDEEMYGDIGLDQKQQAAISTAQHLATKASGGLFGKNPQKVVNKSYGNLMKKVSSRIDDIAKTI